jgi:hypothetical protein
MSAEASYREDLQLLSARLREATLEAVQNRSALARALDEVRGEVDRLSMIGKDDPSVTARLIARARMMLDAWRGISAASVARHR